MTNPPPRPDPVADTLQRWNLAEVPIRPAIEWIWAAIEGRDDWHPLRH
jgi:hypothetical protein